MLTWLSDALDKVEAAGGKILLPKTEVSPDQKLGFFAFIMDTEGNKSCAAFYGLNNMYYSFNFSDEYIYQYYW